MAFRAIFAISERTYLSTVTEPAIIYTFFAIYTIEILHCAFDPDRISQMLEIIGYYSREIISDVMLSFTR